MYFDTATMKMRSREEQIKRQAEMLRQSKLFYIPNNFVSEEEIPNCVKILVSEMASMGETFIFSEIKRHAIDGGPDGT